MFIISFLFSYKKMEAKEVCLKFRNNNLNVQFELKITCLCVSGRERACGCVRVCLQEGRGEALRVCVCVCVCVCVYSSVEIVHQMSGFLSRSADFLSSMKGNGEN